MEKFPSRFDPALPTHPKYNKENCGSSAANDKTEGWGMWCFDECTRKTWLNKVGLGEEVYGGYKTICAGAADADNVDYCMKRVSFDPALRTFIDKPVAAGGYQTVIAAVPAVPGVALSGTGAQCNKFDEVYFNYQSQAGQPVRRGQNCYMNWYNGDGVSGMVATTDELDELTVKATADGYTSASAVTLNGGDKVKGVFCMARKYREHRFGEGGLPAWRYTRYGNETCAARGTTDVTKNAGVITGVNENTYQMDFLTSAGKDVCRTSAFWGNLRQ